MPLAVILKFGIFRMLPFDKELLNGENRKNVTAGDFDGLVRSINPALEDKQLLGKLRQVRNLFANGGEDLKFTEENLKCDFDAVAIELLSDFIKTQWDTGLSLIFQIYFNSCKFMKNCSFINKLTETELNTAISLVEKMEEKTQNILCALVYSEHKNGKIKIENFPKLFFVLIKNCLNHPGKRSKVIFS